MLLNNLLRTLLPKYKKYFARILYCYELWIGNGSNSIKLLVYVPKRDEPLFPYSQERSSQFSVGGEEI